ncbi:hypothetical protein ACFL4A_04965, partial [bacterium]
TVITLRKIEKSIDTNKFGKNNKAINNLTNEILAEINAEHKQPPAHPATSPEAPAASHSNPTILIPNTAGNFEMLTSTNIQTLINQISNYIEPFLKTQKELTIPRFTMFNNICRKIVEYKENNLTEKEFFVKIIELTTYPEDSDQLLSNIELKEIETSLNYSISSYKIFDLPYYQNDSKHSDNSRIDLIIIDNILYISADLAYLLKTKNNFSILTWLKQQHLTNFNNYDSDEARSVYPTKNTQGTSNDRDKLCKFLLLLTENIDNLKLSFSMVQNLIYLYCASSQLNLPHTTSFFIFSNLRPILYRLDILMQRIYETTGLQFISLFHDTPYPDNKNEKTLQDFIELLTNILDTVGRFENNTFTEPAANLQELFQKLFKCSKKIHKCFRINDNMYILYSQYPFFNIPDEILPLIINKLKKPKKEDESSPIYPITVCLGGNSRNKHIVFMDSAQNIEVFFPPESAKQALLKSKFFKFTITQVPSTDLPDYIKPCNIKYSYNTNIVLFKHNTNMALFKLVSEFKMPQEEINNILNARNTAIHYLFAFSILSFNFFEYLNLETKNRFQKVFDELNIVNETKNIVNKTKKFDFVSMITEFFAQIEPTTPMELIAEEIPNFINKLRIYLNEKESICKKVSFDPSFLLNYLILRYYDVKTLNDIISSLPQINKRVKELRSKEQKSITDNTKIIICPEIDKNIFVKNSNTLYLCVEEKQRNNIFSLKDNEEARLSMPCYQRSLLVHTRSTINLNSTPSKPVHTINRESFNNKFDFISSPHFEIIYVKGVVYIRDTNSRFGTHFQSIFIEYTKILPSKWLKFLTKPYNTLIIAINNIDSKENPTLIVRPHLTFSKPIDLHTTTESTLPFIPYTKDP